jgi:signal transduction histidine kinase
MSRHRWTFPEEPGSRLPAPERLQRQLLIGGELAVRQRLAVMRGYSQLMEKITERGEYDVERMRLYSATLTDEAVRLQRLLEQYFAAARLEWDRSALTASAVRLAQLADVVVQTFDGATLLRDGRRLWIEALDDVRGVWDAYWLGEALAALVSNALTYSPVGSEIRMVVRHENGHALLVIEDPGEGIEEAERTVIFEPFQRGTAAVRRGADGWGMGLFIASRAVVAHGGWLEIESGPGEGSAFRVHLPLIAGTQLAA